MKGVVLAAGVGKRMRPVTDVMPKPMVPVVNRPVLEHVVCGLVDAGVDDLLIVVNYLEEQIRAYFGDGSRFGARITYLHQENPAGGTGAAALLGEEFVAGEPFLLTFGDLLLTPANYKGLVESFRARPVAGRITVNWVPDPSAGAAVTVGENERMVRVVEKPPKGTAESNWMNSGIFIWTPAIFDAIRRTPLSPRGELEQTAAIQLLADETQNVTVYQLDGLWSDVGNPAKVLELNECILADPSLRVPVVRADPGAFPAAAIEAQCAVAKGAALGRCEIRDFTCIAAGARVGDGALLRHSALLPGSVVGSGCTLEYAIVASGASVKEGESLIGTREQPAVAV